MKSSLLVFFFCITSSLAAQQPQVVKSITLPANFETGAIDPNGNLYVATEEGELIKFDKDLNQLQDFSSIQSAAISSIQAWNPLRIFLFYENLQQYVILDRFLTVRNEGAAGQNGFVSLMTTSADNNFWLVDNDQFALIKYSFQYNKELIAIPLSNILDPRNYDFSSLIEYQNNVYLADGKNGLFVFDNLGNLLDQIELDDLNEISFNTHYMHSGVDSTHIRYDLKTGEISKTELPIKDIEMVFAFNRRLYIASGNAIFLLNNKKSPKMGDE